MESNKYFRESKMIFYDLNAFINNLKIENFEIVKNREASFYNIPCAFDIETTSFKAGNEKRAIMYVFQFAIYSDVYIGRTYKDLINLINSLSEKMSLSKSLQLIVYVHNLSYEFQFIHKWLDITDIFSDSERSIIKFSIIQGITFKCSYRLSGYSLSITAKNLKNKIVEKTDYDYSLLRHSKTPLTEKEIEYCANDVLIITEYIKELIDEYVKITAIPLTQTGKVRTICRHNCFKNKDYKNFISKLTLTDIEYKMLKASFMGGFTHANIFHVNETCENVSSYDFTSSYPSVMISEKFPMSKGVQIHIKNINEVIKLSKNHNLILSYALYDVKPKILYENIISLSKCHNVKDYIVNNGRIVSAKELETITTEIDLFNYMRFYEFSKIEFGICYIYKKDYLPKEIIETVLKFYKDKTELKGVKDKENEYMHGKELLNSLYGMCVTDIIHDTYILDENKNITCIKSNLTQSIDDYNKDKKRFLFYPWGVYVTAYARNNLYTAILTMKNDYIYSDTDSVKIMNKEKYKEYFDTYNRNITNKISKVLSFYNIDVSESTPKTVKGVIKPLGVWDYEHTYQCFKTLGAKRYIYTLNNDLYITIAGLSKITGKEYIKNTKNPYEFFSNNMYIDSEHTGKRTHTYIDTEIKGVLKDYKGIYDNYNELSYIHLENTSFTLSLVDSYIELYNTYKLDRLRVKD